DSTQERTAMHFQARIGIVMGLFWGLLSVNTVAQAQLSERSAAPFEMASLPPEQIVKNLEERNAQRAAALDGFVGTRVYRMQYRGLPSDRDAEMVVNVAYHAPDVK